MLIALTSVNPSEACLNVAAEFVCCFPGILFCFYLCLWLWQLDFVWIGSFRSNRVWSNAETALLLVPRLLEACARRSELILVSCCHMFWAGYSLLR